MKRPRFWSYGSQSPFSLLLQPVASLYGKLSEKRAHRAPRWKAPVPVICLGNLTLGGAGKTPSALALAQSVRKMGKEPFFLTRGYGAKVTSPVMVDQHSASDVGDEPLLLSRVAPTCVSPDRVAGARLCCEKGADVIIMDDGFQNPDLQKDLSLIVIDGGFGHGNEQIFPAGPLRESLKSGLARADCVIFIGADATHLLSKLDNIKVQMARIVPTEPVFSKGDRLVAFAGIARPDKFFNTLDDLGADLVERVPFGDHHAFSKADLSDLQHRAKHHQAGLITTEKDWVRLPEALQNQVLCQKIALAFEGKDVIHPLLNDLIRPDS